MATTSMNREQQDVYDNKRRSWSAAYWAVLGNQVVVLGIMTLTTTAILGESYRACRAASLFLPGITLFYFRTIGPTGIVLAGLTSLLASLSVVRLRRHLVASVTASVSLAICIAFFAGAVFSSIAPLLLVIRNWLPPNERW